MSTSIPLRTPTRSMMELIAVMRSLSEDSSFIAIFTSTPVTASSEEASRSIAAFLTLVTPPPCVRQIFIPRIGCFQHGLVSRLLFRSST